MSKAKDLTERIVGKAKQAVGEIIGDQSLHEDGKAQAARRRGEQDKPTELNSPKKLDRRIAPGHSDHTAERNIDDRRTSTCISRSFSQIDVNVSKINAYPLPLGQSGCGQRAIGRSNADGICFLKARRSSGESR